MTRWRRADPADDESGRLLLEAVRRGAPVTVPSRVTGTLDGRRLHGSGTLRVDGDGVQWRRRWGGRTWTPLPLFASDHPVAEEPDDTGALCLRVEGTDIVLHLQPHHVDGVLAALAGDEGVALHLAPPVGPLWPLAHPRRGDRWAAAAMSWAIAGAVMALAAVGGSDAGSTLSLDGPAATTARRRRQLQGRHRVLEPALLWGDARWCPRYPDRSLLALTAGRVELLHGHPRTVPAAELKVTSARPAGAVPTPVKVPRSWWVLELTTASDETVFCAAGLETLSLLGAVTSWSVPPGWPTP
ncbi:MAG: hypothetical protein L6311_00785 [Cellulomonas sp.]|nr:hypothetical protein [Cellulomonas sp.]